MPTHPSLETFLVLGVVVGSVVLDCVLLLVAVVVGVVCVVGSGGGGVGVETAEPGVVLAGMLVRWAVLGSPATGVRGMRVPATVERATDVDAALDRTGSRPGTVTGARVALGGSGVRAAPGVLEAEPAGVADCPTTLPQAATSNTVIPCPAAIRAVRRLRWEDIQSP